MENLVGYGKEDLLRPLLLELALTGVGGIEGGGQWTAKGALR